MPLTLEEFRKFTKKDFKEYGKSISLGHTYNKNGVELTYRNDKGYWRKCILDDNDNIWLYFSAKGYWSERSYDDNKKVVTFRNSYGEYRIKGEVVSKETYDNFINNKKRENLTIKQITSIFNKRRNSDIEQKFNKFLNSDELIKSVVKDSNYYGTFVESVVVNETWRIEKIGLKNHYWIKNIKTDESIYLKNTIFNSKNKKEMIMKVERIFNYIFNK